MNFEYSITYSDRKTVSIVVERDRSVVVRVPVNTDTATIEAIVEKKKRWISEKIGHYQKYPSPVPQKEFVSGESLLYIGKPYQLYVLEEDFDGIRFDGKFSISLKNQPIANVLFREWYFNAANKIIVPKAVALAKQIGVSFNKINILDLRFRWGSCTPKNNIHFNWRLIKAPMNVIEYIIVHELVHLLEPNHSSEFWNRVKAAYPPYPAARKWLESSGNKLEIDF